MLVRRVFRTASAAGLLLACVALPAALRGQTHAELHPDAWIRVRSIDIEEPVVGVYLGTRQDSLWVRGEESMDTVPVRVPSVITLERSLALRSRLRQGALFGGVAGGVVGLAVEAIVAAGECANESTATCFELEASDVALVTGLAAVAGAGLGALVGSRLEAHQWLALPIGALRGSYGGPGISIQVGF